MQKTSNEHAIIIKNVLNIIRLQESVYHGIHKVSDKRLKRATDMCVKITKNNNLVILTVCSSYNLNTGFWSQLSNLDVQKM